MAAVRFLVEKTMWKSRLVNVLAIRSSVDLGFMGGEFCLTGGKIPQRRIGVTHSGEKRWEGELPSPLRDSGVWGPRLPGAGKKRQPRATGLSSFGADAKRLQSPQWTADETSRLCYRCGRA